MITQNLLDQNPKLKDLDKEVQAAIMELSKNDEEATLKVKIGEETKRIYDNLDNDVFEILGVRKEASQKSYEFHKAQLKALKEKADAGAGSDELKNQIKAKDDKIKELEEKIKSGSNDEVLKNQIKALETTKGELETKLSGWEQKYKTDMEEAANKLKTEQSANFGIRVDNVLNAAISQMKFKDEKLVSKPLREMAIAQAKQSLLSDEKMEFRKEGNVEALMFLDANGVPQYNQGNNMAPYTAFDKLVAHPALKEVLLEAKRQPGSGTNTDNPGGSGSGAISIGTAKSRTEFNQALHNHITTVEGHASGTDEYQKIWDETHTANKEAYDKLPVQA